MEDIIDGESYIDDDAYLHFDKKLDKFKVQNKMGAYRTRKLPLEYIDISYYRNKLSVERCWTIPDEDISELCSGSYIAIQHDGISFENNSDMIKFIMKYSSEFEIVKDSFICFDDENLSSDLKLRMLKNRLMVYDFSPEKAKAIMNKAKGLYSYTSNKDSIMFEFEEDLSMFEREFGKYA